MQQKLLWSCSYEGSNWRNDSGGKNSENLDAVKFSIDKKRGVWLHWFQMLGNETKHSSHSMNNKKNLQNC